MIKKIITAIVCALTIVSSAQVPPGLIAEYLFNGNANDGVNGNNGNVFGAVLTSDRFGNPNMAYEFYNGEYIELPDHPALKQQDMTVSLWVKHYGWNQNYNGRNSIFSVIFDANGSPFEGFAMAVDKHGYYVGTAEDNSQNSTYLSINPSNSGWQHYVLMMDQSTMTMYIDNVLQWTKPKSFVSPVSPDNVYVGSTGNNNFGGFFNGAIDDIQIFKGQLNANDVNMLFNAPPPNIPSGQCPPTLSNLNYSPPNTTYLYGNTVTVTFVTSDPIVNLNWDFLGAPSTTSNAPQPVFTIDNIQSSGALKLSGTIMVNGTPCNFVINDYINVTPPCPPTLSDFSFNPSQAVYCQGDNVSITFNTIGSISSLEWDFGGLPYTSQSSASPVFNINNLQASGQLGIKGKLLFSGAPCDFYLQTSINVDALTATTSGNPLVYFTGSGPLTLNSNPCYSGNTGGVSVSWSPSTAFITSNTICNPQIQNLGSNTTYVLTVSDGTCTSQASQQVLVVSPTPSYAVLRKVLDGGYYSVSNNTLYFKYDSEYRTASLNYKIYNDQNTLVCNNCQALTANYGENRYSLSLSAASITTAGYYYLEVTNEKNEVQKLKFKL